MTSHQHQQWPAHVNENNGNIDNEDEESKEDDSIHIYENDQFTASSSSDTYNTIVNEKEQNQLPHQTSQPLRYSRSLNSRPLDSSQALLLSDEGAKSTNDYSMNTNELKHYSNKKRRKREHSQNYCAWLIIVLLVAFFLGILYAFVFQPIFDRIMLQKRLKHSKTFAKDTTVARVEFNNVHDTESEGYAHKSYSTLPTTVNTESINTDTVIAVIQNGYFHKVTSYPSLKSFPPLSTQSDDISLSDEDSSIENASEEEIFDSTTLSAEIGPSYSVGIDSKLRASSDSSKLLYFKTTSPVILSATMPSKGSYLSTVYSLQQPNSLSNNFNYVKNKQFQTSTTTNETPTPTSTRPTISTTTSTSTTSIKTSTTTPTPISTKPTSTSTRPTITTTTSTSTTSLKKSTTTPTPISTKPKPTSITSSKTATTTKAMPTISSTLTHVVHYDERKYDMPNDISNDRVNQYVYKDDNEIQPVEISIESDEDIMSDSDSYHHQLIGNDVIDKLSILSEVPQKSKNEKTVEPVWRRLPPNVTVEDRTPPPRPKLWMPFSISASVFTVKQQMSDYDEKPKFHGKQQLWTNEQRKKAPTIVTALLDIGRGNWRHFTRHFDTYLEYFEKLFVLENYMVIFCEQKVAEFIRTNLYENMERLQIVEIGLSDLPLYRYRQEIQDILDGEQDNWSPVWDPQMRSHPEALYADYDILVNSKAYLLHNATKISKFDSNGFFVWVDAGYGHGSSTVIPKGLWNPQLPHGQITVFKLTTVLENVERYTLPIVYRKHKSVISGGFLAGDISTIGRFNMFFFKTFMDLLDGEHVDDDQTVLLMTIRNYRSTFNVLHGGWFDAFKLLP